MRFPGKANPDLLHMPEFLHALLIEVRAVSGTQEVASHTEPGFLMIGGNSTPLLTFLQNWPERTNQHPVPLVLGNHLRVPFAIP